MKSYNTLTESDKEYLLAKNRKYVTFSFDDSVTQDARLIALLDKYDAKGTFNMNSGRFDYDDKLPPPQEHVTHIGVSEEQVRNGLYKNHEIASHTLTHPFLDQIPLEEAIREVKEDAENIAELTGIPTIGFAYPFGNAYNEDIIEGILRNTSIRYARTVGSTFKFGLPKRFMEWDPTTLWCHPTMKTCCDEFLKLDTSENRLLYIWGHAYEMDCSDAMEVLEHYLKLLADDPDVVFVTNGVFYKLFGE